MTPSKTRRNIFCEMEQAACAACVKGFEKVEYIFEVAYYLKNAKPVQSL